MEDSNGELNQVDEQNREDKILKARLTEAKLPLKIADNCNENRTVQTIVELRRNGEGKARMMGPASAGPGAVENQANFPKFRPERCVDTISRTPAKAT
jgi:hypothetical protein